MYGDSLRDYIIGFIVVDPDRLKVYCQETGKESSDALMEDKDFKQLVFESIVKLGSANAFNSLEKPKQITVLREAFSVENGLLTPTMKVKRNVAKV